MQNVGVRAIVEGLRQYEAGLDSIDRHNRKAGQSADALSSASNQLNTALTTVAGAGALALSAALTGSIKSALELEKAMAGIAAVSNGTAEQMQRLTEIAKTAGSDFGFFAVESASGIEALVKAGIDLDTVATALPPTLALAAAGGVDVGVAAEIASNALNQFNLKGSDMAKVADTVAGAANASAIDVNDFALSMQQAGAIASLTGQSFESTSQAIAVMGSNGIKSSDAGTSLKTMLMNLQPQAKQAKDVMLALGLATKDGGNAFFDAEGKAKPFRDIAEELKKSLKGLTEQQKLAALSIIFGSDAARAAGVLADEGAAGFDKMANAMSRVGAEDTAEKRMDSLAGDLQKLRVKWEEATRATDETNGKLREAVQALDALITVSGPFLTSMTNFIAEGLLRGAQAATIAAVEFGKAATALDQLLTLGAMALDANRITEGAIPGSFSSDRPAAYGYGTDVRPSPGRSYDLEAEAAERAAGEVKFLAAETVRLNKEQADAKARADALANALAGSGGKGGGGIAGAAKEAKTGLEEYGIGLDDIRRAGEAAKLSQEVIDAAIIKIGGTILDTGPVVEGYGATITRLSAAFNAAGLDGQALVATILQQQAAAKAAAEAEKAAEEEERRLEKEKRDAEEAARRAEEEALKRRQAILAGIQGASSRDILGSITSRGAGFSGENAANDFSAAVSGFEALTKAEMDTGVATELMAQRLARLSAMFGVLNGDDLASAGATTDAIRKLTAAYEAGTISTVEYIAGLQSFTPELERLAGKVDEVWEAWRREAEAEKEALKAERQEIHASAIATWTAKLVMENDKIIASWNERAEAARKAMDIELSAARAQERRGASNFFSNLVERLKTKGFIDQNTLDLAAGVGITAQQIMDAATGGGGLRLNSAAGVLPAGAENGAGAGNTTNNFIVNASYADQQQPGSVRLDMEAMVLLANH